MLENTLKDVFLLVLRWGEQIEQHFATIRSVCKQWQAVLDGTVNECIAAKFDEHFGKALNVAHNFDLPDLEHYFEHIVRRNDLIPVDRCPYCRRFRCVIRYQWCDSASLGCRRWVCNERIDAYEDRCFFACARWRPSEEMVQKRAYYIYLQTGNSDAQANYYQALAYYNLA
jgi:hypothetical protein